MWIDRGARAHAAVLGACVWQLQVLSTGWAEAMRSDSYDKAANQTVKGGCPDSYPHPPCSDIQQWVEAQRKQGNCRVYNPATFRCSSGKTPNFNAHLTWKIGQKCEDYYVSKVCHVRNNDVVFIEEKEGKKCHSDDDDVPGMSLSDCNAFDKAVRQLQSNNTVERALSLVKLIDNRLKVKAGEAWILMPPSSASMELLASAIEKHTSDANGRELSPVWFTVLSYCVEIRSLNRKYSATEAYLQHERPEDVDKISEKECNQHAHLTKLAPNHPLWQAAKREFQDVDTLEKLWRLGLGPFLSEQEWDQLATSAGGTRVPYEALKRVVRSLVVSAGDRGEEELTLALELSEMAIADGAKPEGGKNRLQEMKASRDLKNALVGGLPDQLKQSVSGADGYLKKSKGCVYWVNPTTFADRLRHAQANLNKTQDMPVAWCGSVSTIPSSTTLIMGADPGRETLQTTTPTTTSTGTPIQSTDHSQAQAHEITPTANNSGIFYGVIIALLVLVCLGAAVAIVRYPWISSVRREN